MSGSSSGQREAGTSSLTHSRGLKRTSTGTFLGKYELLEELSRGGMGIVYRAEDSTLHREVALKMILAGQFASEIEVERFRIEAEATAHLDHPNIVPVYDVGEHEGQPYFTMKLVMGTNLARLNGDRGGRDAPWLRRSAGLMAKVAAAVHHAHERGILHRDLKPSNILLDKNGEPHVTDFGLAKFAKQESDLTLTGATVGTPNYMAPEQAAGNNKQLTTAADIFSLGAILYELITGRPPFNGDTPLIIVKRLLEAAPRRPRSTNGLVDRDLETICMKCLEKDAKRRYASAGKLAEDLEHWLKNEPIEARPASAPIRAVKWVKRQPAIASLIGVSVVAMIGLIALTRYNLWQTRIKLAETLISGGEALAAKSSLARGKDQVNQAYDLLRVTGQSTLPADLSLLDIYRSAPPSLITLAGHTGAATCIALLADQHTLFSGGEDGVVKVWSLPLGRLAASWNAHPGGVNCLALSPDGMFCVSAGKDDQIKVWDAHTFTLQRTISNGGSGVVSLSFSTNGSLFAAASRDKVIQIWEASSGKLIQTLMTGADQISQIAFCPTERRILAANASGGITIWNLDDPSHPHGFDPTRTCLAVSYSADGKLMLRGDARGSVFMNESDTSQSARPNMRMDCAVTAVGLFPNGQRILAGGRDGTVSIWEARSADPNPSLNLTEGEDAVTAISTFADNRIAASASRDGKIRLWDTNPDVWVPELVGHDMTVSRAIFSPDGLWILSVGWDGQLYIWDTATGHLLLNPGEHAGIVSDVALTPDAQRAVSGGEDKIVRIWDVLRGKEVIAFSPVPAPIRCVRFSADGKMIVAGEGPMLTSEEAASVEPDKRNYQLHVWSIEGQELQSFAAHAGGVLAIACSPDGRTVITGGADGKIRFWDTSSWREMRSVSADRLAVNGLALSRDGARLASAGSSSSLKIWETVSGRELLAYGFFRDEVLSAALSADDSLLLAGTDHGDMKLFDLRAGTQLHAFGSSHWSIGGVEFSPKPDIALSASSDGEIRMWDLMRIQKDRKLAVAASKARRLLQDSPSDGAALQTLGQWYEHRRIWPWAIEMFEQARNHAVETPHLTLARCYWHNDQLKQADDEFTLAEQDHEAPEYYLQLCKKAVSAQVQENIRLAVLQNLTNTVPLGTSSNAVILQPGPTEGKDIWTSSHYSWAPDGDTPGGGRDDYQLCVGGWGDTSYSLLKFPLAGYPTNATSVFLGLFCFTVEGKSPKLYLDRITEEWDWKTMGTGRDHKRLWWADKPTTTQWSTGLLSAPVAGGWYSIDITDLYNSWQAGRFPNFGLQLRAPLHRNRRISRFYSSDYLDAPTLRPKLVITPQEAFSHAGAQPLGKAAP